MGILSLIKKKFLWIIIGTAFFYVLLVLISDVEKISQSFLKIRMEFFIPIFALGFLSHILKSFRQKNMLETLGEKISLSNNIMVYIAGLSFVATPGGVGTFIKSIYLRDRSGIPTEKSIAVIFMERFHDLFAGASIILVTLSSHFDLMPASLIVVSAIILAGVYLLIKGQKVFLFLHSRLLKIKLISKNLPDIGPSESFSILTKPKSMTKGWLLSVLGWGVDSLSVYTVFLALNVDLGYLLTAQIYLTSLGYGILSLLPGGVGVSESIADFLLVRQGLELSIASSLVILTRLSTIWFATSIGVVFTRMVLKQKIKS